MGPYKEAIRYPFDRAGFPGPPIPITLLSRLPAIRHPIQCQQKTDMSTRF